MAWVRGDDGAKDNRRVLRAGVGGFLRQKTHKSPQMERAAVFGFVALCVAWSAGKYTDLFIPDYLAYDVGGPDSEWLVAAAIKAGFFAEKSTDEHGDEGWQVIDNGDNLFHVRTREEVELARNVNYTSRLSIPNLEVQARDGDQCRYCLHPVAPLLKKGGDNSSERSRNLDHVDPDDPDTDLVVACRKCNTSKGRRSAAEWAAAGGETLKPPPAERGAETYYHPKTVATFRSEGYEHMLRLPEQSNDQSKSKATTKAKQRAKQDQTNAGIESNASSGRDGRSGLVGSVQGRGEQGEAGSGRDGRSFLAVDDVLPSGTSEGTGDAA